MATDVMHRPTELTLRLKVLNLLKRLENVEHFFLMRPRTHTLADVACYRGC